MLLFWDFFLIPCFPSWLIEEFQSPFDCVGMSNGDRSSSVAIQHNHIIWWGLKFFCHHKSERPNFFNCPSLWHLKFSITTRGQPKSFNHLSLGYNWVFLFNIPYPTFGAIEKHSAWPPFLATKKFRLPSKRLWRLNGDYIFLNHPLLWVIEFFWFPQKKFGYPIFRRLKIFNCHRRGACHIPPFLVSIWWWWSNLIAIEMVLVTIW
jgi:hypothetical protein